MYCRYSPELVGLIQVLEFLLKMFTEHQWTNKYILRCHVTGWHWPNWLYWRHGCSSKFMPCSDCQSKSNFCKYPIGIRSYFASVKGKKHHMKSNSNHISGNLFQSDPSNWNLHSFLAYVFAETRLYFFEGQVGRKMTNTPYLHTMHSSFPGFSHCHKM